MLYLARIGRLDILWSVNKLAQSITKWTKACDKRLNRLISYIHHTSEYKQYCHVGNAETIRERIEAEIVFKIPGLPHSIVKHAKSVSVRVKSHDRT